MTDVDPRLATDLSKLKQQRTVDLSKAAIEARRSHRKVMRAAKFARTMNRTFKGILGAPNRRQYAQIGIARYGVKPEDAEAAVKIEQGDE